MTTLFEKNKDASRPFRAIRILVNKEAPVARGNRGFKPKNPGNRIDQGACTPTLRKPFAPRAGTAPFRRKVR